MNLPGGVKRKENEMEDEWWKQVEIGSERVAGQGRGRDE